MEKQIYFDNECQRLYGMIHIPEGKGPWPAVALCHGFTGHRNESHSVFVKLGREMAKHGIAVLRFDFRGSGESEGLFEDMTVQSEISDAKVALDFLANYPDIDTNRIGLLGYSMGGLVAVYVGPADPRIKAMALWAPAAGMADIVKVSCENASCDLRGRYDLHGYVVGPEFCRRIHELEPLKTIKSYKGRLLIVHGTQDKTVPPADSEKLFEVAVAPFKERELIEGADHTWSSEAFEKAVIDITTNWFRKNL